MAKVDLERGTSPASREVKIYYITQAMVAAPMFILFTNQTKPLHFSYQRFLENRLRAEFDFEGTPIRFTQRLKKREPRRSEKREPRYTKEHESAHTKAREAKQRRKRQSMHTKKRGQRGGGKRRS
jgi:hypothetical protein